MKPTILVLFFAISLVYCNQLSIDADIISFVNEHSDSWIAAPNAFFDRMTLPQAQRLLGWKPASPRRVLPVQERTLDVPANFDARTQWPNCTTIGAVQNQAKCGSCWAFGAVEAISDRFCIHQAENVQLSFQDIVTCDGGDGGCEGGDAATAWTYAKDSGLVTYDCLPYTIPTCAPSEQPCLDFVTTPDCVKKCEANYTGGAYTQDKHFVKTVYRAGRTVAAIQTEIATNGPVEACFTVYQDFLAYKSGVYQHTTGPALGGHCIKLLGYGVENDVPYWLAANSWTDTWGDKGFFKIISGKNDCGIEGDVVAGMVAPHSS